MYWNFVKSKVYEGRFGKPFASEAELKRKKKHVWNICANDLVPIMKAIKQFSTNESYRRKTRKVYQHAVWLMLFQ